jgi:hypothetical protein
MVGKQPTIFSIASSYVFGSLSRMIIITDHRDLISYVHRLSRFKMGPKKADTL